MTFTTTPLAVDGGKPTRTRPWPVWPVYDEREGRAMRELYPA